jgi:hypothetical protein
MREPCVKRNGCGSASAATPLRVLFIEDWAEVDRRRFEDGGDARVVVHHQSARGIVECTPGGCRERGVVVWPP